MIASDDFELNQLINFAEKFFIKNYKQFLRTDPIEILQIICHGQISNISNVKNFCLKLIRFEPNILFKSAKFINLPASLLEIILKQDHLNLDEIIIWENIIKWGLAQEKFLTNKDISKWRQEEFNIFKRIIYKFIPLIKFYRISSEDYFNRVRPYEEILSKELRDENLKFYLVPGHQQTFDNIDYSILINKGHIKIFANWIDKRVESDKYTRIIPYKFNLLYRASRDGNTTREFHEKCDNKGATVVVAKITNSEQIVGGYNPFFWDSNSGWKSTNGSFIFSFTDRNDLQNVKVGYSNGSQYSVYSDNSCGPWFGYNGNLGLCNNNWLSYFDQRAAYPKVGIPANFNVEDYEVFQVIRK